ncbi:hypothetical protein HY450_01075 [Candidatus Pacearchaeota archaeon]|nr:hypothetical protein [Candidatus Pacearchaeota archaeon]
MKLDGYSRDEIKYELKSARLEMEEGAAPDEIRNSLPTQILSLQMKLPSRAI